MSRRKIVKSELCKTYCFYSTILVQCYAFSLLPGFSWPVYPWVPPLGEGEAEGEEHTQEDTPPDYKLRKRSPLKKWANEHRQAQYSFERGERKVSLARARQLYMQCKHVKNGTDPQKVRSPDRSELVRISSVNTGPHCTIILHTAISKTLYCFIEFICGEANVYRPP